MNKYAYSPFGELLVEQEQVTLNIGFNTKYEDESGLTYYNNRYYSHSLGRFISQDPIFEDGGVNLYSFTANDPLNHWDILGEAKITLSVSNITFSDIKYTDLDLTFSSGATGKITLAKFNFTVDISAKVTLSCSADCPISGSVSSKIKLNDQSFFISYKATPASLVFRAIPILGTLYTASTIVTAGIKVYELINNNLDMVSMYINDLEKLLEDATDLTLVCSL